MKLELYLTEVIKGRQQGILPSCIRLILKLLSVPFRLIVTLRNVAFDRGWFRRYRPPVPMIISIGNIVAGGTGKTPVTLMLAQEFYNQFSIAILSRGYRSPVEKLQTPTILSAGNGPLHSARYCGDEPYLLAEKLPKAHVIVGKDRHQSSDLAAKAGAQLILLDDGMQHRHLARDLDIVVMDIADPFGQGHFLPRGLLRENLSSLSRANLIVLNHVQDQPTFETIKKEIARYTLAPVIGTKLQVEKITKARGEEMQSLEGVRVGIFCGIAKPENFEDTVRQLGAQIVGTHFIPDHQSLDQEAFKAFAEACVAQGASYLVCTEKDKVKIDNPESYPLPILWLQMKLVLVSGENEWAGFIDQIKTGLTKLP